MFKNAIPVYAENKSRDMNTHLLLREKTASLRDTRLFITGYSFFRLWVNDTFVFFGPARAAGGYARVEQIDLTAYHKDGDNEILVEVCGYGCGSLASVDQPSFVAAELRRGAEVLLYTGRDFEGFCPDQRVQKVERYSVQRHFGEVWDYTAGDPFAANNRIKLVPVETKLTYLPATPMPCFDYVPAQTIHSLGGFEQDDTRRCKKNRYSWAEIPEEWGYFPESEIEIVELHHSRKLDAPSGTALSLAQKLQNLRPESRVCRGAAHGRRLPEEIHVHSLRMGEHAGSHTILFGSEEQTITLTHTAHTPLSYAVGAIRAAEFLLSRKAGLYDMSHLLQSFQL